VRDATVSALTLRIIAQSNVRVHTQSEVALKLNQVERDSSCVRTDTTNRKYQFGSFIRSSFLHLGKKRQYLGHDLFHGIGCIGVVETGKRVKTGIGQLLSHFLQVRVSAHVTIARI